MNTGLWLNVGSSHRAYPGFENIDRERGPGVRVLDVRLGLPYPNDSVEVIVCSHVLEHFHPFKELPFVLNEFRRVLQPGGTLRLAVPDLGKLAQAYMAKDFVAFGETQRESKEYIGLAFGDLPTAIQFSIICFGNNSGSQAYDGHHVCFDAEAMKWTLNRAGFTSIEVVDAKTSRHPTLLKKYQDVDAPEQILVEASK